MQIGMIGLGRMGMNMVRRLLKGRQKVVAYNRTPDRVKEIVKEGAQGAYTLKELVGKLRPPRLVWLMLPAGRPVDEHIEELEDLLDEESLEGWELPLLRHRSCNGESFYLTLILIPARQIPSVDT